MLSALAKSSGRNDTLSLTRLQNVIRYVYKTQPVGLPIERGSRDYVIRRISPVSQQIRIWFPTAFLPAPPAGRFWVPHTFSIRMWVYFPDHSLYYAIFFCGLHRLPIPFLASPRIRTYPSTHVIRTKNVHATLTTLSTWVTRRQFRSFQYDWNTI